MAELIGYQAPAVLAFTWRREGRSAVVTFSWSVYTLILLAIGANLCVLNPHGKLWEYERPAYGIVQRILFGAWFLWSFGVGVLASIPRPALLSQRCSGDTPPLRSALVECVGA